MPPPDASPSTTRAASVADMLRDRIFDGALVPGSHLMEVALAAELGVSRTPVRDALARLADEGLLVYQANRGFVVRRFEIKDVIDAATLRASLEGLGCRLLGERGLQAGERQRLQDMLDEQRRVLYGDEWNDARALLWQDLNLDFHFVLLELADNPWLTAAVRRARRLPIVYDSRSRPHDLQALRLLFMRQHSQQAFGDHCRIVDALALRETTRAESLMREHILTKRDVVVQAMRTAGTRDRPVEAGVPSKGLSSRNLGD